MQAIQRTQCPKCTMNLKGVAGSKMLCPMCKTPVVLPSAGDAMPSPPKAFGMDAILRPRK